ncbi:MAG: hypothetical protein WD069_08520 [Planctomycetales bacterium]
MDARPKVAWAVVFLFGLSSGAFGAEQADRPPAPPTAESLTRAATAAGFRVRKAAADLPAAARSKLVFQAANYDDPLLAHLRQEYRLEEVVAGAEDEWGKQLLLKEWVHDRIPGGTPKVNVRHAAEILEQAAKGETFWCTYYAITYTECALALGWQARKIGVDRNHGPEGAGSTHHGVSEVWSNRFRKWILIDPQSNLHFEKDGVPLSAWEIRAEWLRNGGQKVDHVVGVPPRAEKRNPAIVWWKRADEDETACYFWLYVSDHALAPEGDRGVKFLFPQDDANKDLVWYQNAGENGEKHRGYRHDLFVPTQRIEDVYWTVGIVEPRIASATDGTIRLGLDSYCPNRTAYEIARDDGTWEAISGASFEWQPKSGVNVLKLRTVSAGGVTGPVATLRLEIE